MSVSVCLCMSMYVYVSLCLWTFSGWVEFVRCSDIFYESGAGWKCKWRLSAQLQCHG